MRLWLHRAKPRALTVHSRGRRLAWLADLPRYLPTREPWRDAHLWSQCPLALGLCLPSDQNIHMESGGTETYQGRPAPFFSSFCLGHSVSSGCCLPSLAGFFPGEASRGEDKTSAPETSSPVGTGSQLPLPSKDRNTQHTLTHIYTPSSGFVSQNSEPETLRAGRGLREHLQKTFSKNSWRNSPKNGGNIQGE